MTQKQLMDLLFYDRDSGRFFWKKNKCVAGNAHVTLGYRQIMINKHNYYAHRLAWLYCYGEMPDKSIDHINGNRDDNRIENLRLADSYENCQNSARRSDNTSGHTGVSWYKREKKWVARIYCKGIKHNLGYFDDKQDAINAYVEAKKKLHWFNPSPVYR